MTWEIFRTQIVPHWWPLMLIGLVMFTSFVGEQFHLLHKRRMAAIKRRGREVVVRESLPARTDKTPGPCVHRRVVPVHDSDGERVGWLCRHCDEQLPADWAVEPEDL